MTSRPAWRSQRVLQVPARSIGASKSNATRRYSKKKAGRAARLPNLRRLLLAIRLLLLLIRHPLLEGVFLQSVLTVVDFLGLHLARLVLQLLGERGGDGRVEH